MPPKSWLFGLALAMVICASTIIISGAGWNPLKIDWNFANSGAFGDSFGPISALMASLAALSAIATYQRQSKELSRVKLREQEADKSAIKSDFERTFFQLLEHHRTNVLGIDIDAPKGKRTGQDAFRSMIYNVKNNSGSNVEASWSKTYQVYENDLGHYFRFLYHVIKFVDNSNLEERYFYIQIVRATLSESELVLLGLNCLYGHGAGKFRAFVEKYALLHNASENSVKEFGFADAYAASAFERAVALAAR